MHPNRIERSGAYGFRLSVYLSVHLSVTNFTCKMSLLNYLCNKAYIWYEGTSHRFRSAKSHSSVGSIADLRTGGRWFDPRLVFFPRIDDSHCYRIHSSLTVVRCFDNGYVGKQPVTWKEYCAEYWLK